MFSRPELLVAPESLAKTAPRFCLSSMLSRILTVAFVLAFTFAGCTDKTGGGPSVSGTSSSTQTEKSSTTSSSGEKSPGNGTGAVLPSGLLELDSCPHGIASGSYPPKELYPTEQPSGWKPRSSPAQSVLFQVFLCDRISLDGFERGPVFFLFEAHSNVNPPPKCIDDTFNPPPRILHELWISDAELAIHLKTTYGMPAEYAQFNFTQSAGPVTEDTWRFQLPGGEESSLVSRKVHPDDQTELPVFRLFWVNQVAGISYLQLSETLRSATEDPNGMTGQIAAPFIQASPIPYAGYGAPLADGHLSGAIVQFRDLSCEKPL